MKEKKISMQDELLKPAEIELEGCIELLLREMIEGGYDSGTASLKLTIRLEETQIIDSETHEAAVGMTPVVSYKATYGVKRVIGVSGGCRDERQVVERSEDGRYYIATAEKAQKSLF